MKVTKSVSCIICAYNEGSRIASVLAAAHKHPLLAEVIVVDDGSTDGTYRIARSFPGVHVIRLEKNAGKSNAVAEGVKAAHGELLFLLDADLYYLTPDNISKLIEPVLAGTADVSISLRGSCWQVNRLVHMDVLTGERIVPRELLEGALSRMRHLPAFGVEVFINRLIVEQRLRVAVVRWKNVFDIPKTQKFGWWKGAHAQFKMMADISHTVSPLAPLTQMYSLFLLRSDVRWSKWLQHTSRSFVRKSHYDTTDKPPKSSVRTSV